MGSADQGSSGVQSSMKDAYPVSDQKRFRDRTKWRSIPSMSHNAKLQ
jgi:hypothetical protein